jgi:hypothetical protein
MNCIKLDINGLYPSSLPSSENFVVWYILRIIKRDEWHTKGMSQSVIWGMVHYCIYCWHFPWLLVKFCVDNLVRCADFYISLCKINKTMPYIFWLIKLNGSLLAKGLLDVVTSCKTPWIILSSKFLFIKAFHWWIFLLNQAWGRYRELLNFEYAEMKYLMYQIYENTLWALFYWWRANGNKLSTFKWKLSAEVRLFILRLWSKWKLNLPGY